MSKELKDISKNVMNQIHEGKAKMKPRIYFVIGSILTFLGLVFSTIVSIFFIGLLRFSFRTHYGWRAQYKLNQMLSDFPWWILIPAIVSLVFGVLIIRKYDFSYKIKPWIVIVIFILVMIFAGWIIDVIGLNDILSQHGPMKGMMFFR